MILESVFAAVPTFFFHLLKDFFFQIAQFVGFFLIKAAEFKEKSCAAAAGDVWGVSDEVS